MGQLVAFQLTSKLSFTVDLSALGATVFQKRLWMWQRCQPGILRVLDTSLLVPMQKCFVLSIPQPPSSFHLYQPHLENTTISQLRQNVFFIQLNMHLKLSGIWLVREAFPYCSFSFWPKSLLLLACLLRHRGWSLPQLSLFASSLMPQGSQSMSTYTYPNWRLSEFGHFPPPRSLSCPPRYRLHLRRMLCPAQMPSLCVWCSCEDRWDRRVAGSDTAMPRGEAASLCLHWCSLKAAPQHRAWRKFRSGSWLDINHNVDVINMLSVNKTLPWLQVLYV